MTPIHNISYSKRIFSIDVFLSLYTLLSNHPVFNPLFILNDTYILMFEVSDNNL